MMCFFVFKQNTANEWRISDWSSDVFSSDLSLQIPGNEPFANIQTITHVWNMDAAGAGIGSMPALFNLGAATGDHHRPAVKAAGDGRTIGKADFAETIGRAACREGVCQSV